MQESVRRYPRGYGHVMSRGDKAKFRRQFLRRSMITGAALTLIYLLSCILACWAIYFFMTTDLNPMLLLIGIPVMLLLIVRQQRALENVVHFGSHLNFSKNQRQNDFAVNILAAWPMLSDVRTYRLFHREHHGCFGSNSDPCKQRFQRMGLSEINLTSNTALVKAVMCWLPLYVREYYRDVGSRRTQLLYFLMWHMSCFTIIALAVSLSAAFVITGAWMAIMGIILPVVRSIAEISEHDYDLGRTEFGTTFSNIGFWDLLLWHPAGDAWHLLHHLYPTVPWWLQRQAHCFLMEHDASYRLGLHRTSMVEKLMARDGASNEARA